MADWKTRISVPAEAKRNDVIQIRTLIQHPMESGFRRDLNGAAMPRDILVQFICRYHGTEVFQTTLFPAIAANPYLSFHLRATESGPLEFEWQDQHGASAIATASLHVVD